MKKLINSLSIKNKLRLLLITSTGLASILSSLFVVYIGISNRYEEYTRDLMVTTQLIGSRNAAALAFQNPESAAKNLEILSETKNILRACIYDKHGSLFASYQDSAARNLKVVTCKLGRRRWNNTYHEVSLLEGGHAYASSNIYSSGELVGVASVVSYTTHLRYDAIKQIGIATLAIIITLVVVLLALRKLQALIYAPIKDVVQAAQNLSLSDYPKEYATYPHSHELGALVNAFNTILIRNGEYLRTQEARTAATSNALKNSLGVIESLRTNYETRLIQSLRSVVSIINERSLGDNIQNYISYLSDLSEEMQIFQSDIETVQALSSIYERSILDVPKTIVLNDIVVRLLARIYSLNPNVSRSKIVIDKLGCIEAREEIFAKMIEIGITLIALIIPEHDQFESFNISRLSRFDSDELVFHVKRKIFGAEICEKLNLSDFFEQQMDTDTYWYITDEKICSEDFKFYIDSLKYVGSANHIAVNYRSSSAGFSLCFILSSTAPSAYLGE